MRLCRNPTKCHTDEDDPMKPFDDELMYAALERYHFERESGSFFKIVRDIDDKPVITGKFAGTNTPNGIRLTVNNRHVMAHHLAWRIFRGEWPIASVKFWNHNPMDCRDSNLYSPQEPKKIKKKAHKESAAKVDFLKSIGITRDSIQRAMLDRIRREEGDKAYIEAMHMMQMIDDDQKARMLFELRENT